MIEHCLKLFSPNIIFLIRYRRIMERSEERKARAKEEGREKMEKTMKPFSFVVGE